MSLAPGILARGSWTVAQVDAAWREHPFEPDARATRAADAAIEALRERGSPAHDGLSGRLVSVDSSPERLRLELQPARWALRLDREDAAQSVSAMCVVRAHDGRWLAGRRAPWLATWSGRWALGAGGAVEPGENPADTLARELCEEWSVTAERLTVEALVLLPQRLAMVLGVGWLAAGAEVVPDAEHDEYAWWPADVTRWPEVADEPLRTMASMLAAG